MKIKKTRLLQIIQEEIASIDEVDVAHVEKENLSYTIDGWPATPMRLLNFMTRLHLRLKNMHYLEILI